MHPRDREKLQRHYPALLEVTYSAISPHLISTFVLTLDMHDEIESRGTERNKMDKLLRILPARGDRAMKELITALRPSYAWIANRLAENDPLQVQGGGGNGARREKANPNISVANHIRDISRILQRSTRAATHWVFLAKGLQLSPTTVIDIKREMTYSGGCEFALYSTLDAWVTKTGNSKATFSKLISLLEKEEMNQSAEEIAEYWASLCEPSSTSISQSHSSSRFRERSRSPVITDVMEMMPMMEKHPKHNLNQTI